MVILMALVWLAVGESGHNQVMTQSETVSYFVFAALIYSLSNFHTWYVEDDIKLGGLSKYLLKPVSASHYYLGIESANAISETLFKAIFMIPAIFLLGFGFSVGIGQLLLFILFMPLIFYFSFNTLIGISYMAFWLSDVFAIRWSLMIIIRFLAGILVPISFFPELLQKISWLLPFQHLAFTPIQVMLGKYTLAEGLKGFLILAIWTAIAAFLRSFIWKKGTFSYESTGA
jgi:ABC-2 type transport system permease protein